jgi:hypothetical protein
LKTSDILELKHGLQGDQTGDAILAKKLNQGRGDDYERGTDE